LQKEILMKIRTVLLLSVVISFCLTVVRAVADTTSIQTIITNIKANTDKITSYYAEFTLSEDSLKADTTHACNPKKESWAYGKPDTVVFSFWRDTGWVRHNSVMGSNGEQFPVYEYIFMLNILADTFPNSWINASIPFFTATVDSETNDSIYLSHMNSSVHFNYIVDKNRWVVTRIVAGGFNVYDANYTWSRTAGGIYYPSGITMNTLGADEISPVCAGNYPFTNIKVNGTALSSVLPRPRNASSGRCNSVSIGLTRAPREKVAVAIPYGENVRGLSITDVSGRLVQMYAVGGTSAANRTLLWDGKDLFSQAAHAGVYFVTVTTDRARVSARLLLVK
jgi:hypothetical protein